jgi:hypothetical protein
MTYEQPTISDYGTLAELTAGQDHSFETYGNNGDNGKTFS